MAAAPGGSFYAIANVWNCDGSLIESGFSNEQNSSGTSTSPVITDVVPNGKHLLIMGQNFSGNAKVTSQGVDQKTLDGGGSPGTALKAKKLSRSYSRESAAVTA